jgi:CRISPR-associated endonuclease Csn1
MPTIWGFDLGVTSVGWAVVRWDEVAPEDAAGVGTGKIVGLGARIFPESREDRDGAPKNAARRQARLARRRLRRRRWRRVALRRLFAEAGLLPAAEARPAVGDQDPVLLRQRGLSEPLTPHELGWALFHLLKRRGFQGSRKRPDTADGRAVEEEKEAKTKAEHLAAKMGGRKLGEYLAGIQATPEKPERRRDVGQTRRMVIDELDALWSEQQRHHPALLTDALRERLDRIALFQRPTYFRRRTIGRCELEPEEERALKAEWLTQRFETLQLVNALRLEGGNQRRLDESERASALAYLETERRPTWAGLRKAVGLPRQARFTHERGKKESVRGNATEVALRAALGAAFPTMQAADAIRAAIGQAWHAVEYRPTHGGSILEIRDHAAIAAERGALAARARAEWGLSPAQADALATIELPDGVGRHSLKAMRRLLPHLERGDPYMTAVQREYAPLESADPQPKLPGPNPSEIKNIKNDFVRRRMQALLAGIRNPTVLRTLGELQKVANTLLHAHGRPDLIRLELTRELKQSVEERSETDALQNKRAKAREVARGRLKELGAAVTEENVLRLLLWEEQGKRCPYSGQYMGCADALSAEATEIDHIFPVSRSFDDSQANKVLCFLRENRAKANRTPHEWLASDADRWTRLTQSIWPDMEKAGWAKAKHRRCLRAAVEQAEDEAFTNRQLVDTSFIARAARDYLGLLFGGGQAGLDAVQPVPGRATALLRRAWGIGLGSLLRGDPAEATKARDDHRHHAVDALVVALTGPGVVQRLSRWWQEREMTHIKPAFLPPWPNFREEARAQVEAIVVSHRVQAKLSGPLHDAQPYGRICDPYESGKQTFVKRKKVQASVGGLSSGEIQRIVDPAARRAVERAVAAARGDLKRAFSDTIRMARHDGTPGPVIRHVRVKGKNQDPSVYDRAHSDPLRKQYKTDQALHSIAIFDDAGAMAAVAVLKHERLRQLKRGHSTGTRAPSVSKPLFTLCRNDTLERMKAGGEKERVIVRDFYRSGQIFIEPHWYSGPALRSGSKMATSLLAEGWRKVSVDAIGRVRPAR